LPRGIHGGTQPWVIAVLPNPGPTISSPLSRYLPTGATGTTTICRLIPLQHPQLPCRLTFRPVDHLLLLVGFPAGRRDGLPHFAQRDFNNASRGTGVVLEQTLPLQFTGQTTSPLLFGLPLRPCPSFLPVRRAIPSILDAHPADHRFMKEVVKQLGVPCRSCFLYFVTQINTEPEHNRHG